MSSPASSENDQPGDTLFEIADYLDFSEIDLQEHGGDAAKNTLKAGNRKVAFKTRSVLEVLDDGYKWRKYGKKMVKNSPNPRNYYRCSAEGCNVKKRVERARDDSSYVITTYDGNHNHHAPSSAAGSRSRPNSPPLLSFAS